MPTPNLITCIYCKELRPQSREHALQKNLGAELTEPLPPVCTPCNSGFSDIDQALGERSPVSLSRLTDTSPSSFDVKLGSRVTWTDPNGRVLEMELVNEWQSRVLPQLHLSRVGEIFVTAADPDGLSRLTAYLDDQIDENTLCNVRTVEDPQADTAAIVLHRSKEGYVRLPSAADLDWFLRVVQRTWVSEVRPHLRAGSMQPQTIPNPSILCHLALDLNRIYRAVAKSAFNTLAIERGAELVLRSEFDPIRQYIRGDVQIPPVTEPGVIGVDPRFVKMISPDQQTLGFGSGHTIVFIYRRPELMAIVTLYEMHQFAVRFPPVEYDEQEPIFGHQFSVDRSGNRPLQEISIVRLLLQSRPNYLGPNTKQILKFLEAYDPAAQHE